MPLESRQRILEYLKKSGKASVAELSKALALTSVTIRHHLDALLADGLIAEPIARHKSGPGRPEMVYRITPAADSMMPRNYGELCRCLIEAVEATNSPELEGVLAQMGTALGDSANSKGNVRLATGYLEQRGYFPSVAKGEGMLVLKLANCPYLEIAEGAPSLCQFDRALIESLFGQEVKMGGRIVEQEAVCTFQIGV